jgi:predicted transcriptional regulator
MSKRNCLFATNDGQFFLARNKKEAQELNPNSHPASDSEVRAFWVSKQMAGKPLRESCKELGVSHQTVCNWYKRACSAPAVDGQEIAVEKFSRHKGTKRKAVAEAMRNGADIEAVSVEFNVAKSTIVQYCRAEGVSLAKESRRIADEKILELANGRTWSELAEASGRSLTTLRNRIYRNHELATAVRGVMKLKFIKGGKVESNERA